MSKFLITGAKEVSRAYLSSVRIIEAETHEEALKEYYSLDDKGEIQWDLNSYDDVEGEDTEIREIIKVERN